MSPARACRRSWQQWLAPLLVTTSAACFLGCEIHDAVPAPLLIPIPEVDDGAAAVAAYYSSICDQMRQAWLERDRARLAALLATHDREDAPAWAREQMRGYGTLQKVDGFERAVASAARIARLDPNTPLGEATALEFSIPALGAEAGVESIVLGEHGSSVAAHFQIAVQATDYEPRGGRATHRRKLVLSPERAIDLRKATLRLPFAIEEAPPGVVLRELEIRVELLPGKLEIDGAELPCRRAPCATTTVSVWPAGVEPIRKAPLTTLREALRRGDVDHFPHVWLAARFLAPTDRGLGLRLLLDTIRLGTPDAAVAAMAAAREIVGDPSPPIGDREAWLAWWQAKGSREAGG